MKFRVYIKNTKQKVYFDLAKKPERMGSREIYTVIKKISAILVFNKFDKVVFSRYVGTIDNKEIYEHDYVRYIATKGSFQVNTGGIVKYNNINKFCIDNDYTNNNSYLFNKNCVIEIEKIIELFDWSK